MTAARRRSHGPGQGLRPLSLLVVAVLVSLATAACGSSAPSPEDKATATSSTPRAGTTPASPGGRTAGEVAGGVTSRAVPAPTGAKTSTTPRRLRPVRISIPAIGVAASMTDLGIASDGSIEVPSNPRQVGWLDTTPAPGQQGPAVVAGHVDSTTGPAVFFRLSSLSVGDVVRIERRDGSTARFTVDGVRIYRQNQFPTREVYGPVPGPALRLITCGGDYVKDDGGYQDNVVVYAS